METEDLGGRIAEFDAVLHSGTPRTAAELDVILAELIELSSTIHAEMTGDEQASVAKVDELRHQFTAWYNDAAAREQTATRAELSLTELDVECAGYRRQWAIADEEDRAALETQIVDCLGRIEAKPGSADVAREIRMFLHGEAHVEGY